MPRDWRPQLGAEAERDIVDIFRWKARRYGIAQARHYRTLILSAIGELQSGPDVLGSKARNEILSGLRTLHVARHGRRARHFLMYRAIGNRIEILRVLHDAMELARHLPRPAGRDDRET